VSTEKQESEGASLDAQQRVYRTMAAKNGWETVAEFRGCESATQAATDRRVLQQVLACVRENPVDAVYVHEQSRLTRGDELEVAILMRELKEKRLKIIISGVVRDLDSIDERFMVGIQSLVDRAESERIKERLTRGKMERARNGKKNSGPSPFGYQNPPPGAEGRGKLRIVPEEAVVVRKLFATAAQGKGVLAVAKTLNDLGMRASRGGKWGKSSVTRVLMNPVYIGTAASGVWRAEPGSRTFRFKLKNDKAIVIPNAHEPIIDRGLWDAVHNRQRIPRTAVPRMLTGLVFVNGKQYHGDSDGTHRFYRAERGIRGMPWLLTETTDDAVWTAFVSLATAPEFVQRLLTEAKKPGEELVINQEIEYLEDQVGKCQRRLDNLIEMRADGEIDKDTHRIKSDEARAAMVKHKAELAGLRSKLLALDGTVATRIVKAVQMVLAGRTKLTGDQKRSILASIVRRVDVVAEKTGANFARAQDGRVTGSGGPSWGIKAVSLRLALPRNLGPTAGNAAAAGEAEAAGIANAAQPCRSCQLGTTCWDCAQLAEAETEGRGGHLGTIS